MVPVDLVRCRCSVASHHIKVVAIDLIGLGLRCGKYPVVSALLTNIVTRPCDEQIKTSIAKTRTCWPEGVLPFLIVDDCSFNGTLTVKK